MTMNLTLIIDIAAIVAILVALFRALKLRHAIPGGIVKSTWNILTALIALFVLGYLLIPFYSILDTATKDIVASLIFFFGALFVIIVIHLFQRIMKDLGL